MNVSVYSTPTCPWCDKAKSYLNQNNIDYTNYNVAEDRNAAMDMIRKSGQRGVPVLDINGKIIIGFDKPAIDSALGL
ncbi:glutaredoxin domain-containing protein [Clostridiisalibacter paucivorans]|uniref:glutaredoxin domain-containing protein n=1 Tax=Clostridiisalibacter paucivorans TaxID=408753 RepID=UPI00047D7EAB|nr:glutaredoxin domain-containing protein [Clostridiisalibacter paucivorans]